MFNDNNTRSTDSEKSTETMMYTLHSGVTGNIELNNAQQKEWFKHYKDGRKYITTEGGYIRGLNPKLVSVFKIKKNSEHGNTLEPNKEVVEETKTFPQNESKLDVVAITKVSYKVQCVCGARYVSTLRDDLTKLNCKYCGKLLYPNRLRNKVDTIYGKAWITTNLHS
ncbi:hypothetical protein [Paenibacillus sp. AGC30]